MNSEQITKRDYTDDMADTIRRYVSTRYEEEGEGYAKKLDSGGYAFMHKIGDDISDYTMVLKGKDEDGDDHYLDLEWTNDEEFQKLYDEISDGNFAVETNDWLYDRMTIEMYDQHERTPFPPYHKVIWEGTRSRYYQLVNLAEGVNDELEAIMKTKDWSDDWHDVWMEEKEKFLEKMAHDENLTYRETRFIDIYSEQMEVDATFYYDIGCRENPDEELGWEQ